MSHSENSGSVANDLSEGLLAGRIEDDIENDVILNLMDGSDLEGSGNSPFESETSGDGDADIDDNHSESLDFDGPFLSGRRRGASVNSRRSTRGFTIGRSNESRRVYTRYDGTSWWWRLRDRVSRHWNKLRTPMEEEGLDFEENENDVDMRRYEDGTSMERMRWITAAFIALTVSFTAIGIDLSIDYIADKKADHISYLLEHVSTGKAFVFFICFNLILVGIASLLVAFLDNRAKGSGVPEVKSYLNGRKIHRVISLRTLFTKLIGVVLCVGGSMVVGKEGPMIHAGAIIGAVISQGKAENQTYSFFPFHILAFRNDKEKRSFVAIGCACGVAAAFSAPLGAVLFVIEEASSYWSVGLTWRTFFACMVCVSVVDVVLSGMKDAARWGVMSQSAVVSFGGFEGASQAECYPKQPQYTIQQIPVFLIMGVCGGLTGALFNRVNLALTRFRFAYVNNPFRRMIEALLISLITSSMIFGFTWLLPCRSAQKAEYAVTKGSNPAVSGIYQTCDNLTPLRSFCYAAEFLEDEPLEGLGAFFSDFETLSIGRLDRAVHHLFHSELVFTPVSLILYGTMVLFLACITYGVSIPSGLFVPLITAGSCFGRIVGQVLWKVFHDNNIDPGTYALLGAASLLGGVTRMTISIVVILIETTNNSTYAVPIMLTIMTAKLVGDYLNDGIYDIHVDFQGISFIHDTPDSAHYDSIAADKMVPNPVTVNVIESVKSIVEKLRNCSHNGFPVVNLVNSDVEVHHNTQEQSSLNISIDIDTNITRRHVKGKDWLARRTSLQGGSNRMLNNPETNFNLKETIFEGMILRRQLCVLLWEKAFESIEEVKKREVTGKNEKILSWRTFYRYYPRCPTIEDVVHSLTAADYEKVLDLRPYISSGALSVHHSVNMSRVHLLFRALALRHLTVVNTANNVVGIITRKELIDHDEDGY